MTLTEDEVYQLYLENEAQRLRSEASPHIVIPSKPLSKREQKELKKAFKDGPPSGPLLLPPDTRMEIWNRQADALLEKCEKTDEYIQHLLEHQLITGRQAKKNLGPSPIYDWGQEEPIYSPEEESTQIEAEVSDIAQNYGLVAQLKTGERNSRVNPAKANVAKTLEDASKETFTGYYKTLQEAARVKRAGDEAYKKEEYDKSSLLHEKAIELYKSLPSPPTYREIVKLWCKQGAEDIRRNLLRLRRYVLPD